MYTGTFAYTHIAHRSLRHNAIPPRPSSYNKTYDYNIGRTQSECARVGRVAIIVTDPVRCFYASYVAYGPSPLVITHCARGLQFKNRQKSTHTHAHKYTSMTFVLFFFCTCNRYVRADLMTSKMSHRSRTIGLTYTANRNTHTHTHARARAHAHAYSNYKSLNQVFFFFKINFI